VMSRSPLRLLEEMAVPIYSASLIICVLFSLSRSVAITPPFRTRKSKDVHSLFLSGSFGAPESFFPPNSLLPSPAAERTHLFSLRTIIPIHFFVPPLGPHLSSLPFLCLGEMRRFLAVPFFSLCGHQWTACPIPPRFLFVFNQTMLKSQCELLFYSVSRETSLSTCSLSSFLRRRSPRLIASTFFSSYCCTQQADPSLFIAILFPFSDLTCGSFPLSDRPAFLTPFRSACGGGDGLPPLPNLSVTAWRIDTDPYYPRQRPVVPRPVPLVAESFPPLFSPVPLHQPTNSLAFRFLIARLLMIATCRTSPCLDPHDLGLLFVARGTSGFFGNYDSPFLDRDGPSSSNFSDTLIPSFQLARGYAPPFPLRTHRRSSTLFL